MMRAGRGRDGQKRLPALISTGLIGARCDHADIPRHAPICKPIDGFVMTRWFRFYTDVVNDPKIQSLPCEIFRAELMKAIQGQSTIFDPFMDGPYNRPASHEWAVIRTRIFERDNFTCTYCGAHGVALECDHVVPVKSGGSSEDDNLTTACKACNRSKAGKPLAEWRS